MYIYVWNLCEQQFVSIKPGYSSDKHTIQGAVYCVQYGTIFYNC